MLESEGLQTRSLQKIQMPGDNKQTPFSIDTAPAQRNPTPTDNKQIPVAKELVRSSPAKECQLHSCAYPRIMKFYSILIIFSTCFLPVSLLENKVKRYKTSSIGIVFEENILREFSVLQC